MSSSLLPEGMVNTGFVLFRARNATARFLSGLYREITSDPLRNTGKEEEWEQARFDRWLRRGGGAAPVQTFAVKSGSTNASSAIKQPAGGEAACDWFWGLNATLRVSALDVTQFCNGHVFFVQRLPQRLNVTPFVAHATFQYGASCKAAGQDFNATRPRSRRGAAAAAHADC